MPWLSYQNCNPHGVHRFLLHGFRVGCAVHGGQTRCAYAGLVCLSNVFQWLVEYSKEVTWWEYQELLISSDDQRDFSWLTKSFSKWLRPPWAVFHQCDFSPALENRVWLTSTAQLNSSHNTTLFHAAQCNLGDCYRAVICLRTHLLCTL